MTKKVFIGQLFDHFGSLSRLGALAPYLLSNSRARGFEWATNP